MASCRLFRLLQDLIHIITTCNSSCGKVLFSQACVIPSVHRGGTCVEVGGMHGNGRGCAAKGGHAWQRGMCVARGACVQEKRPLKRAVRILLECNLVRIIFVFPTQICFSKCFLDTLMYYMLNIVFYQWCASMVWCIHTVRDRDEHRYW